MTAPAQPTELCEQALAAVGSRAEAIVTATAGTESLTRFAQSFIHQNHDEESGHVTVYVVVDGAGAVASTTRLDREAIAATVDKAIAAAKLRPADPDWPGVTGPAPVLDVEHWDDATADASPSRRAEVVRAFVDAGGGLEAAGYCSTSAVHRALATTAGQVVSGRSTFARVQGIHRTGKSDGSAQQGSVRLSDLDGAALGTIAAQKARAAEEAVDIEPGAYEVVIEPSCVGNMLTFLASSGWNAKSYADGTSFVHLGEKQFDESISIRDDVTDERTVGFAFDGEGTPKRRVDFVRNGESAGLAYDRRTAKRAGTESTGHFSGSVAFGGMPANVIFEEGDCTRDEMVASMARGLLVSDFWYVRILDPKTQVCTGLTRNGLFLVEDGEVVGAVRNLRFTQSYASALAPGKVLGVGRDWRIVGGEGGGAFCVPSLHLAAWNFTGGAKG